MTEIKAQPGPQWDFLSSPADIVFYGGAAGGGKTFGLLMEPLRHKHNKDFRAVTFRRTFPQITNPGGLWDESVKLYSQLEANSNQSEMSWTWPSGAKHQFAHMQHAKNRLDWQGSQVALINFDELSHFERIMFFYMLSRLRSTSGVRPYIRATTNPIPPDDEVGGWIHEFVSWYIDEEGWAIPERSGQIRWFVVLNDELRWADTPEELKEKYPDLDAKSFTFIKSSVYDNKILLAQNPEYLANLMALPYVEMQRLLGDKERGGNWLVKPSAGKVFNRAWFEIVDAAPAKGRTVRFWDLAATEKEIAKDDPDYTASIKMRRLGDLYYVLDCFDEQLDPSNTDTAMKNFAGQDGKEVDIRFEKEPGASGKRDSRNIVSMLVGYDVQGVPPQGDKLLRARALSAQARAGNVKLLRGPWNEHWLTHMHGQPDIAHDDIMDASSGAFNELSGQPRQRPRSREY